MKTRDLLGSFRKNHFSPDISILIGAGTMSPFLFLNGALLNTVPLLGGELFTAIFYDGVAGDPGPPKMSALPVRHLRRVKPKIAKIVASHAHEKHVGNLNWLFRPDWDSGLRFR